MWVEQVPRSLDRYRGMGLGGWTHNRCRVKNGQVKPKESAMRKINTYYPFDLVSLSTDHVNWVIRSKENEVMDR